MKLDHIILSPPAPGNGIPAGYHLDCPPGRVGPARVVEVLPGRAPLVHDFGTGLDALGWLLAEHEATLLLDTEIIDLTPVVAWEVA